MMVLAMKKIIIIISLLSIVLVLVSCKRTKTTTETQTRITTTEEIDEFKDDMLEYTLSSSKNYYTVSSAYESNILELTIPSHHNNLPVRYVDRLNKFENLRRVILPDTIYGISSSCFEFAPLFVLIIFHNIDMFLLFFEILFLV